jgi:translation initiation factor eIF-2B subunit gamma
MTSFISSSTVGEFQAVILTQGDDNVLYPLCEEVPKSLLPIANRPLLMYQLRLLEKAGFEDIILVVSEQYEQIIGEYVARAKREGAFGTDRINISVTVVEENLGTAECLRAIGDKISSDFIVINGDLVTESILNDMADRHRMNDATVTMLLKDKRDAQGNDDGDSSNNNNKKKKKTAPKKKKKIRIGPNGSTFFGFEGKQNRVVYKANINDMNEDTPRLMISKALLRRVPNIYVTDEIEDMRLYIFSSFVIDIVKDNVDIIDIAEDLLPLLLDYQFRHVKELPKILRQAIGGDEILKCSSLSVVADDHLTITTDLDEPPPSSIMIPSPPNALHRDGVTLGRTASPLNRKDGARSPAAMFVDKVDVMTMSTRAGNERTEREENVDFIKCFAHVLSPLHNTSVFCNRLINLEDYIPMNQVIYKMRHNPENTPWERFEFDQSLPKLRKSGSLVGANCTIGEKVNVKNSVLGTHCKLGNNVNINNCIIMDHVVIGDNCSIKNSILCSNVNVESKCSVSDCQIGTGTHLEEGKVAAKEVLTNLSSDSFFS